MTSRVIVTKADLEALYPAVELGEFAPTHRAELIDARSRKVVREDLVALGDDEGGGVRYAWAPGEEDPRYAVISTGKWQGLEQHGLVRASPVRYVPDYVRPNDRLGHVYFVQSGAGGPVKIGWSQDIPRRVGELQTANAHALRVLGKVAGTLRDEAAMHARFAHLRMEAEWFHDSPEIHAFLEEVGSAPIPGQG